MGEEKTYKIGEASKLTGYARGTLLKLIQSGSLKAREVSSPWGGKFRSEYLIYESSILPHIKNTELLNQSTNLSIIERIETLEREVAELKCHIELKRES